MDPFEDILNVPISSHAQAGRKFRPKAKPQPAKVASTLSVTSVLQNSDEGKVVALPKGLDKEESFEPVDRSHGRLTTGGVGSSVFLSPPLGTEVSLKNDDKNLNLVPANTFTPKSEDWASLVPLPLEITVSNMNANVYSRCSTTEADSSGICVDGSATVVPETIHSNESDDGKVQPQATLPSEGVACASVPLSLINGETDKSTYMVSYVPSTAECIDSTDRTGYSGTSEVLGAKESLPSGGPLEVEADPFSDILPQLTHHNATLENSEMKELRRSNDHHCMKASLSICSRIPEFAYASQPVNGDSLGSVVPMEDVYSDFGKSMGEPNVFSELEFIQGFVGTAAGTVEPAANKDVEARSCLRAQLSSNSTACKESVTFTNLETPHILEQNDGTFQASDQVYSRNENSSAGAPSFDAVDFVVPAPNAEFLVSETVHIDDVSLSNFPSDAVFGYSSMSFTDCITPNPSALDFPMSREQADITAGNIAESMEVEHLLGVRGMPEKEKSNESPLDNEMNEDGRSTRQLRKRATAPKLVNDLEHEDCANQGFPTDPSSSSVLDEEDDDFEYRMEEEDNDNDDDTEYRADGKSKKRRASKKQKKPASDKEKTVRKRKKSNNAPEESGQVPRKKFSHSTRRKKERVKDLLSIPEEELDRLRLPILDVLLLGEHKEQLAKKEAKESETCVNTQSVDTSLNGADSYNEEDAYVSEPDGDYPDGRTNCRAGPSHSLFNSHSFMNKERTARWSKQDTELFYEGIRQFGSDLSMIQQLFPGRTRPDVKRKFKKEERQYPLRLSEALHSRANDHSYFRKVIKQLQVASALSGPAPNEDDRSTKTGVEEGQEAELDPATNICDEAVTSKKEEEALNNQQEVGEDRDVLRSDGSDGDDDIWSAYESR